MITKSVVLLARIDDPTALVTQATYSTVVSVDLDESESLWLAAEYAMEIAGPVSEWTQT